MDSLKTTARQSRVYLAILIACLILALLPDAARVTAPPPRAPQAEAPTQTLPAVHVETSE